MPKPIALATGRHSYSLLIGFISWISMYLMGCVTPKQLSYFQDDGLKEANINIDSIYSAANNVIVSKGLILTIRVNSITSPGVATPGSTTIANPFDPIIIPGRQTDPPATTGYLVDKDGNLALPLIGKFSAAGRTTLELAELIRTKLEAYLKEPTVTVQYTTNISVLGEVNKPSLFALGNPIISLPSALGLAGDLTTYARRDNILVIRTVGSGKLVYQRLDLTKISVLKSPFYILQGGDVVYVSPGKARAASVDRSYQIIPIVLSSLSVIATVLSLTLR